MTPLIRDLLFTGKGSVSDRYLTHAQYGKEISAREHEVLNLRMEGLTNAQAGHEMGIGEQTVKNHITAILAKTGAPNLIAVVRRYSLAQCPPSSDLGRDVEELEHRVAMLEVGDVSVLGAR